MDNIKEPASFLTLPGELRNVIYRLALVKEEPIVVDADVVQADYGERHAIITFEDLPEFLSRLKADMQIKAEAQQIFLEENSFTFTDDCLFPNGIEASKLMAGDSVKESPR